MSDAGNRSRIRRGTTPRQRPTVSRRGPVRPAPRRPSAASRALATIPLPMARIKRALTWLVLVAVLCGVAVLMWLVGVPQWTGEQIGLATARAGLVMQHVEVRGNKHLDTLTIDEVAYDNPAQLNSLLLVDIDAIRARLLRYGWVEDARVSRRLPDTLVVDVVERTPAAIWQYQGRLSLIDAGGVVLAPVNPTAMPDLPLVIGPQANSQIPALTALLAAAPQLQPMINGASWIGGRRWDVRFQSGETLSLPEGDAAARRALVKFQGIDGNQRLLGRGLKRFDMRLPGKMVVRMSDEPGQQVEPPAPAGAGSGAAATTEGTGEDHGTA